MKKLRNPVQILHCNFKGIKLENLQPYQQDTPSFLNQNIVLTVKALRGLAAIANALKQRAEQPPTATGSRPARRRRGHKPSPRGNRDSDRSRMQAGELCSQTAAQDSEASTPEAKPLTMTTKDAPK
jgi:hypothetical protein